MLTEDCFEQQQQAEIDRTKLHRLNDLVNTLDAENKKVIFTMGKGGVGKTTIAAAIALGLAKRGKKVHLTTTDPAAHLKFVLSEQDGITMSHIDEAAELKSIRKKCCQKRGKTAYPARISPISRKTCALPVRKRLPCSAPLPKWWRKQMMKSS